LANVNGQQIVRRWQAQNDAISIPPVIAIIALSPPALFAAWLALGVRGQALLWWSDTLLFSGAFIAAIAAFAAGVRYRGTSAGRAWLAIGLGMLLMAFGEGAWGLQELILNQEVPSPSAADIGYLGFYPPVFLGLLMMPQAPLGGLRRAKLTLDLAVATAAIALISFHFVVADLLAESATFGDWVTVAYPVGDVLLICAAIVLLVRGGRNVTNMNLGILALGFAAIGLTDSLYTYLSSVNDYNSGNWIDLGWMLGYGLVTIAAASAATRTLNVDTFRNDEQHATPVWQSITLNAALIPVAAVLILSDDKLIVVGFTSLVALAFASHLLTHLEIARLNRHLVEMADELKAKVQTERIQSILRTNPQSASNNDQADKTPDAPLPDVAHPRFGR
jgi:hypothetical protein